MVSLEEIYRPHGYKDSYANLLDTLYTINGKLNRAGVKAPDEKALASTDKLYGLIGRPLDAGSMRTIHVGGTNGKGTTAYKMSQCSHLSGLKVGLFVSPHISSFRERVQVNHELIPEVDVMKYLPHIFDLCVENEIKATMFEITFILAALYFKETNCDVAVIEVGLGGELDATNVMKTSLSIITSVALDHVRVLGGTVEEIAKKKGGILKHGVPAIVGPDVPLAVLEEIATDRGAHLYTIQSAAAKFSIEGVEKRIEEALSGDFIDTDQINAIITLVALHILSAVDSPGGIFADRRNVILTAGADGCALRPPCRWQEFCVSVVGAGHEEEKKEEGDESVLPTVVPLAQAPKRRNSTIQVILDVGHNPAAVGALLQRVKKEFLCQGKDVNVLYAVSRDKNIRECVRAIVKCIPPEKIHFAQSSNWRAASFEELNKVFMEEAGSAMTDLGSAGGNSVEATIRKVLGLSASSPAYAKGDAVVIVCGTGFIMPDARRVMGVVEPCDVRDLTRVTREGTVDD